MSGLVLYNLTEVDSLLSQYLSRAEFHYLGTRFPVFPLHFFSVFERFLRRFDQIKTAFRRFEVTGGQHVYVRVAVSCC